MVYSCFVVFVLQSAVDPVGEGGDRLSYIEAKNFRYTYAQGERPALAISSLTIENGEFVLLIGPSGGGKTTLLRRLAKESGIRGSSEGMLSCQTDGFGFVWQDPSAQLVCHRVEAEIAFGMENRGIPVADMERRLAEVVTFFGLEELLHREVAELSAGEKQTVNIAGAIAGHPDLLLLDEPTSALDPIAAEKLADLIRKIHRELGVTVLVTEQRPEFFLETADRILVMEEGCISFDGSLRGLPESEAGREFLPYSVRMALNNGADWDEVLDMEGRRRWWKEHRELSGEPGQKKTIPAKPSPESSNKDTNRIRVKNIRFCYHRQEPDVLRECSMELERGITALVGGNGSGKTTLAEVIAGYRKPYRGKVSGRPDTLSYLPADPGYLFIDEPFDGSGGEREWHGIELVLSKDAVLYILDEPTKGLDPARKRELAMRLEEKRNEGKQVLLVTHDIEFAAEVSDSMAMMYDGRIVACGKTQEFLKGNMFYTTQLQRLLSWG